MKTPNKPKAPSEKICEELFISYTFLKLAPERLIFYAPSQREEKQTAYDALYGVPGRALELYLQFKSPNLREGEWRRGYQQFLHEFKKLDEQLYTLRTRYPVRSAFYIFPTFWDFEALVQTQHHCSVEDVLDCFIAIPVSDLPADTSKLYFDAQKTQAVRSTPIDGEVRFTHPKGDKGSASNPYSVLGHGEWLYGSELIQHFLTATVGCEIEIISRGTPVQIRRRSLVADKFLAVVDESNLTANETVLTLRHVK